MKMDLQKYSIYAQTSIGRGNDVLGAVRSVFSLYRELTGIHFCQPFYVRKETSGEEAKIIVEAIKRGYLIPSHDPDNPPIVTATEIKNRAKIQERGTSGISLLPDFAQGSDGTDLTTSFLSLDDLLLKRFDFRMFDPQGEDEIEESKYTVGDRLHIKRVQVKGEPSCRENKKAEVIEVSGRDVRLRLVEDGKTVVLDVDYMDMWKLHRDSWGGAL